MTPITTQTVQKLPPVSALRFATMSAEMTSTASTSAVTIIPEGQRRYGFRLLEIVATSEPELSRLLGMRHPVWSSHPIFQTIDTLHNPEFVHAYEARIRGPIEALLHSALPAACGFVLVPLRMYYEDPERPQAKAPIIVLLSVEPGFLSDEDAGEIVAKIAAILGREWQGEDAFVDLCQNIITPELRAVLQANVGDGRDLRQRISEFYDYPHPLPGFPIGPKDLPTHAGSFSGFIKHGDEAYGLTCNHVIRPSKERNGDTKNRGDGSDGAPLRIEGRPLLYLKEPYQYQDGEAKIHITIPTIPDHEVTKQSINSQLDEIKDQCERDQIEARESTLIWGKERNQRRAASNALERHKLEYLKMDADRYHCDMGYLYASSGVDRQVGFYEGQLDWAIFQYRTSNVQNEHHHNSLHDTDSGFQLNPTDKKYVNQELGPEFLKIAHAYVGRRPSTFKPLRIEPPRPDEIFFKLASRTMNTTLAKFSGVMAVVKEPGLGGITTHEECFIHPRGDNRFSNFGDSGAPIVDADFKPYGMVWGGHEVLPDITFVTPFKYILKDIELQMGWEAGSVHYC